jgi:DNA polymerase III epsilon subunit family exonuclease
MSTEPDPAGFLAQQTFVAFDTETTGLWAPSNRIVEIAAVKFRPDSEEIEAYESLINPGRPIPAETTSIHGITDEMVSEAPPAAEVLNKFVQFAGSESILIAHNAAFDISFIGSEMDRAGIEYPSNLVLDTVDVFRRYFPGQLSYSLLSLSQQFGISQSQEHRGLSDSQLVRLLFQVALPSLPKVTDAAELGNHLSVYRMSDWRAEPAELPASFADLTQAVEQKRAVEIVYQSSGSAPSPRIIHPIQVHRLGGVHYIVAYCERVQAERTFRLDRIISYRVI